MQHSRMTATREQLLERIAELERQIEEQFLNHVSVTLDEVRRARADERERLERICRNVAAELEIGDRPISSVGAIECANLISALGDE